MCDEISGADYCTNCVVGGEEKADGACKARIEEDMKQKRQKTYSS